MKYLPRERAIENQSILRRCTQFLNNAFLPPKKQTESVSDFNAACGLSPESRLKLHRVQGRLTKEWNSAISFTPIQGRSVKWTSAPRHIAVSRPRIRVQIRRIEPEPTQPVSDNAKQASHEIRGLDDIFPERITDFFEEKKTTQKPKPAGSVVVDYRIVRPDEPKCAPIEKCAAEKPELPKTEKEKAHPERFKAQFDESLQETPSRPCQPRRETRAQEAQTQNESLIIQPSTNQPEPAIKPEVEKDELQPIPKTSEPSFQTSWISIFWAGLRAKISDVLTPLKPVLAALEENDYPEPQMLAISAPPTAPRIISLARSSSPRKVFRHKPAKLAGASLLETVTGAELRESKRYASLREETAPPFESATKRPIEIRFDSQPAAMPQPRLDATLFISKHRKFMSQNPVEIMKPVLETIPEGKLGGGNGGNNQDQSHQDQNHIDYMWRNNQILARSISHLADQYFQRAALEESVGH